MIPHGIFSFYHLDSMRPIIYLQIVYILPIMYCYELNNQYVLTFTYLYDCIKYIVEKKLDKQIRGVINYTQQIKNFEFFFFYNSQFLLTYTYIFVLVIFYGNMFD